MGLTYRNATRINSKLVPEVESLRKFTKEHELKRLKIVKKSIAKQKKAQKKYTTRLVKQLTNQIVKSAKQGLFSICKCLNRNNLPYSIDWLRHELNSNFYHYNISVDEGVYVVVINISWEKN